MSARAGEQHLHPDITAESAGERAVAGFCSEMRVHRVVGAHQERGAKNSKDVAGRRKVKPCPNIPPPALHHDLATSNNSEHKQATTPMPHKGHRARVPARYHLFSLGTHHVTPHDLSSLRVLSSVGEPFNLEAWNWCNEHLGEQQCAAVDTFGAFFLAMSVYLQLAIYLFSLVDVITPFSGAVCVPTKPGSASATWEVGLGLDLVFASFARPGLPLFPIPFYSAYF
ncbi:hypothetical protein B0H13DRAFT_2680181 [Mycena leptocephala]|nr:hypothetical protein B0H13DRAFT_2680181 [Mycena leptocephala]